MKVRFCSLREAGGVEERLRPEWRPGGGESRVSRRRGEDQAKASLSPVQTNGACKTGECKAGECEAGEDEAPGGPRLDAPRLARTIIAR
ncbi:MAG: hypothetical protein SFZ23_05790 [Planctomycetota bacterium]|nr:hypothetical protein [Planctomycetota bacterium]